MKKPSLFERPENAGIKKRDGLSLTIAYLRR